MPWHWEAHSSPQWGWGREIGQPAAGRRRLKEAAVEAPMTNGSPGRGLSNRVSPAFGEGSRIAVSSSHPESQIEPCLGKSPQSPRSLAKMGRHPMPTSRQERKLGPGPSGVSHTVLRVGSVPGQSSLPPRLAHPVGRAYGPGQWARGLVPRAFREVSGPCTKPP